MLESTAPAGQTDPSGPDLKKSQLMKPAKKQL